MGENKTFMQAVYAGAVEAAKQPENIAAMKGLSSPDFDLVMKTITEALDTLPPSVNLHVVLMALTFVNNAILLVYRQNEKLMATATGGTA